MGRRLTDQAVIIGITTQLGDVCEVCGQARLIAEILRCTESSFLCQLTTLDGKLYFKTFDRNNERGMWVYDPENSAAGVRQLDTSIFSNYRIMQGRAVIV